MPRANKQPKKSSPPPSIGDDSDACKCPTCPLRLMIVERRKMICQQIEAMEAMKRQIEKDISIVEDMQMLMESMIAKFNDE